MARRAVVVLIAAPLRAAALEYNTTPRRDQCDSCADRVRHCRWSTFAQVSGPDMQLRDPSSRYAFMCASLVHRVATQRSTAATTPAEPLRFETRRRVARSCALAPVTRRGTADVRLVRCACDRRAFVRAPADGAPVGVRD